MGTSLGQSLVDAGFPRTLQSTALQTLIDPTLAELVEQCIALSPSGRFTLERRGDGAWAASLQTDSSKAWGDGASADDAAAALWLVVRGERFHRN